MKIALRSMLQLNAWVVIIVFQFSFMWSSYAAAQSVNARGIYSGVPWFDNRGSVVSAHGANIIKEKERYYLFGEAHTDTSNAFAGVNCYSSADLYNWKWESVALPVQQDGKLGSNRVGERPKIMKCPSTGQYIMFMHVDTLTYRDQFVGYATADQITGPYNFQGPLLFNGKPIKKWDMGSFQDDDGSGYILMHGGDIFKLSDDYRSIVEQVCKSFDSQFESPALFRKDSIYYFLGSRLTSWEKNDNYYFTSNSLKGPWISRGLFAPEGSLTWYSQTTFVLPIKGINQTTYMYMGDRWSFPKQASAATYVWQPISVDGYKISIPDFKEEWSIDLKSGHFNELKSKGVDVFNDKKLIAYTGKWRNDTATVKSANEKSAKLSLKFEGTQVALYGMSRPDGGYARIAIYDRFHKPLLSSIVDFYCRYPVSELKFLTPVLQKGQYFLEVEVMGERGNWSDKRKSNYGSTGYKVSVDKIIVSQ